MISATISLDALKELKLKEGKKATSVMVGVE